MQKHLLDEIDFNGDRHPRAPAAAAERAGADGARTLAPGEQPAFDLDAT